MTNAISLSALPPELPMLRVKRIRLLSRGLVWLLTLLLGLSILYVTALIVVALYFSDHVLMGAGGTFITPGTGHIPGMTRLSDLPLITHVAGAIASFIQTAPWLLILWHLRRLFQIYAAGVVFGSANAAQMKRIGLWLIICPFALYMCNALFRLAGGVDRASWLHIGELQALVAGAIVFAIAQVMEHGHEIEQEKDSFV